MKLSDKNFLHLTNYVFSRLFIILNTSGTKCKQFFVNVSVLGADKNFLKDTFIVGNLETKKKGLYKKSDISHRFRDIRKFTRCTIDARNLNSAIFHRVHSTFVTRDFWGSGCENIKLCVFFCMNCRGIFFYLTCQVVNGH